MTQQVPASIVGDGSLKVAWVPTLADPANPTQTELRASTTVELSCYLAFTGFKPATAEQAVTDDRLCARQTYERGGRFTDSLELDYVYRPQEPTSATNKAYTSLRHRTDGYIVARWGADWETDWTTADIVDVYPSECGVQMKQPIVQNGPMTVTQKIFIRDAVQRDVAVV